MLTSQLRAKHKWQEFFTLSITHLKHRHSAWISLYPLRQVECKLMWWFLDLVSRIYNLYFTERSNFIDLARMSFPPGLPWCHLHAHVLITIPVPRLRVNSKLEYPEDKCPSTLSWDWFGGFQFWHLDSTFILLCTKNFVLQRKIYCVNFYMPEAARVTIHSSSVYHMVKMFPFKSWKKTKGLDNYS